MSQFLQKLFQQLADRYITESLSKSKLFHWAAVKIVKVMKDLDENGAKAGAKVAAKTIKETIVMAEKSKVAKEAGSKVGGQVGGFLAALRSEIVKDINKITGRK